MLAALPAADRTRVRLRTGDVTDAASLGPAIAGADVVVHLVAIARDFNGGRDLARVNTEGTRNVIEAARPAGVRRFVHLGAMGVVDDPRSPLRVLQGACRAARGDERARLRRS